MSASLGLHRWVSETDASAIGLELPGEPRSAKALGTALDVLRGIALPNHSAFLLVRMMSTDHAGLVAAIQLASAFSTDVRVCLAIDRSTLARIDPQRIDTSAVGLLLDEVDEETPPADVTNSAIEAVRFRREFVRRATRQIRLGCALESTLGLARSLGLASLAPSVAPGEELPLQGIGFDWRPACGAEPAAREPVQARARRGDNESTRDEFQLSR
jgi:hypothetical protein